MKDVIRHNRRFQLGTVAALVNPRETHSGSRNSACRKGVSTFSFRFPPRSAYMRTFGPTRASMSPQLLALAALRWARCVGVGVGLVGWHPVWPDDRPEWCSGRGCSPLLGLGGWRRAGERGSAPPSPAPNG